MGPGIGGVMGGGSVTSVGSSAERDMEIYRGGNGDVEQSGGVFRYTSSGDMSRYAAQAEAELAKKEKWVESMREVQEQRQAAQMKQQLEQREQQRRRRERRLSEERRLGEAIAGRQMAVQAVLEAQTDMKVIAVKQLQMPALRIPPTRPLGDNLPGVGIAAAKPETATKALSPNRKQFYQDLKAAAIAADLATF